MKRVLMCGLRASRTGTSFHFKDKATCNLFIELNDIVFQSESRVRLKQFDVSKILTRTCLSVSNHIYIHVILKKVKLKVCIVKMRKNVKQFCLLRNIG